MIRIISKALVICAIVVWEPVYGSECLNAQGRLILTQGQAVLAAYFDGRYQQVKRATLFYGFGWLDSHRVFIAYQDEKSGEAVAEIEVVDLLKSKTTKLMSIGGAGESNFDVNPTSGKVIYSDAGGIKLLKISGENAYQIQEIKKGGVFWGTFWIDEKTIGAFVYGDDGKSTFMKLSLP